MAAVWLESVKLKAARKGVHNACIQDGRTSDSERREECAHTHAHAHMHTGQAGKWIACTACRGKGPRGTGGWVAETVLGAVQRAYTQAVEL